MADSNQSRRMEFADNDPFAELTRIMGLDPHAAPSPAEPAASGYHTAQAADDFDIDLEKELLGELDFSEFDEDQPAAVEPALDWRAVQHRDDPEQATAADWRDAEPEAAQPVEWRQAAAAEDFEVDHSVEDLAASLMEENLADAMDAPSFDLLEPAPLAAARYGEDAPADVVAADDADDEFDGGYDEEIAALARPEVPVTVETAEPSPVEGDLDYDMLAQEFGRFDEASAAEPALAAAPSVEDHVSDDRDDVAFEEQDEPSDEAGLAAAYVDEPAVGSAFDAAFAPIAEETQSLSLEDELNALLAAGDTPDAAEPEAVGHESVVEAAPAAAMPAIEPEAWKPAVATFGRANFAQNAGTAPRWEPVRAETPAAAAPEAELPVFEPEPVRASFEPASYVKAAPAMLAVDDFADVFGEQEQQVKAPVHLASPSQPAAFAGHAHAEMPDIDTVEMTEAAFHVTDDLDLPELDYAGDQPPRAYDDLDDEFAQAFDDLVSEADYTQAASAPPMAAWAAAAPVAMPAATPMDEQQAADAYALGEGGWDAAGQPYPAEFDYDTELEQAIAMASYEDGAAPAQPPRSRGLLVAAVVAGVAVIGGAGVFGMSMFGGGSDTPAVVRADTDPMKVRPENPGGTTVPNQDSEAYARVSGDRPAAAPAQETLITTAEEPMDIAGDAAPAGLAPGISEEGEESMLAPLPEDDGQLADGQPKGEDRLVAADEPSAAPVAEEVAAVAPRRVRTMVVRPDGTMVPREEAAPAAEETVVAAAPVAAAPVLAPAAETAVAPAAEEDAGPTVDTPATVGVVPSQRTEPGRAPQATAPAAQPAPVVQASAPAAAAPAAAAASEWSMQIASQPTAEGAQATYQDLARRYGSVLEGRGVNIVKADIAGKGTYYRVRIPSASRDEAINLCTRYKAAGGSCFVSR